VAVISESPPEKRAPDDLGLVQRFVNSADLETGEEELHSPAALVAWLAERGLVAPSTRATAAELERAREAREGLRSLLLAHNGGAADPELVRGLERIASRAVLRAGFAEGAPRLEPAAPGVDGALARLLAIVTEAAAEGSWQRLKACADEGCRWAFYDRTKNRSGRWCSMAACGNQQKARAYRERAKGAKEGADKKARS
jgi:predicted RNA-binding Zn ribbon-like protein